MLDKVIAREAQILIEHKRIKQGVDNVIKLKKKGPVPGTSKEKKKKRLQTLNGCQSIHMTMSKGKRICPECKGNGYLKNRA